MFYHANNYDNLLSNTPSHLLNSVLYYEDPIVMPALVDNGDLIGEQSLVRATSDQLYGPGYFTNLLNENDIQSFDNHRPLGVLKYTSSMDVPLPSTEAFTTMSSMPPISTTTTTPTRHRSMPSAPSMAAMSTMASTDTKMPFEWMTKTPHLMTPGPPPVPIYTKPNMRKRTTMGFGPATRTSTTPSGPAYVLDEHHPKPEGAYYPPTKRIKRESVETPRKPWWTRSTHSEDGSVVSLPRSPLAQPLRVTPQPATEQCAADSRDKSGGGGVSSSTYNSYNSNSEVSSSSSSSSPAASDSPAAPATVRPPFEQKPPPPIIPRPLEPFPEAGTIMNFPLPQIDHQGQRPAAAERYFSFLQDDFLLRSSEPLDIEMEYRNALRIRERVDWDCRRLGLRLRYLRRCQARMAERYPAARESEWQREDFGEQFAGCGF